ncbi:MAG TPA: hypothetical protein VG738_17660 [Chitinophagaceae bacterium]|nr:hypothetical protein [Chitinophagaceae bacterium]
MKHIILLAVLCIGLSSLQAQKVVEKHATISADGKVTLNIQIADSIKIITWNKNEAYIKATVDINDNKNNDDYVWTFDDAGGNFDVKAKFPNNYHGNYNRDCNCSCGYESKIYAEVYVPENANISVETINGDITISGKTADVKAHTISGFVDFAVTPDTKAYVKMSTISGTMYSNVDLGLDDKKTKRVGGNNIDVSLNGGGKSIDLASISGDIFFRKS